MHLPSAVGAQEAPKLLLVGPSLPCRLLLEGAERSKLTLGVHDLFHGGRTEGADQLVLQVCDAHVETESFHVGASEVGPEAGALQAAFEGALLRDVAEQRPLGDTTTLADPTVVREIQSRAESESSKDDE